MQAPSFFFDVVPIFCIEARKLGFFDKFYIVTDFQGNTDLGSDCKVLKLKKDRQFVSNMLYGLDHIEEDTFAVACEDNIFTKDNDLKLWNDTYDHFLSKPNMGFLRLSNTKHRVIPLDGHEDDDIFPIATKYRYFISLQIAFWRKSYFKFVAEPGWTANEFEWKGAKKARRAVRHDKANGLRSYCVKQCVARRTNFYQKGRYYRTQFVDYAVKNNIDIDWSRKIKCKDGIMTCEEYIQRKNAVCK